MGNIVVLVFLSLDGVAEEPSDWFFDDGPELFEHIARVLETQTEVLLGRGTRSASRHWSPTTSAN